MPIMKNVEVTYYQSKFFMIVGGSFTVAPTTGRKQLAADQLALRVVSCGKAVSSDT